MKKFAAALIVAISCIASSGCSINHYVKDDYPQYLSNNNGESKLPQTKLESGYFIAPNTEQHRYEFRSVTTGYANLWIVEFGKILDQTLQSKDVQGAFAKLERRKQGDVAVDNLITFDLVSYTFSDFGAHIVLKITLAKNGTERFTKTYQSDGKTQGGKMFWGGAFAMKNAIQQSTKLALDEIMRSFVNDANNMPEKG